MIKGKLLIIGGAEDTGKDVRRQERSEQINHEFERFEILKELLHYAHDRKIEIITTGSRVPDEVETAYRKAFEKINHADLGFIYITEKEEARTEENQRRVEKAGSVFFSGGDQFRLSSILGGTPIVDIIKERYIHDPDFLVAGTSAGAMVMSGVMIAGGGAEEALFGRDLKTTSGLGFLQNCIIDTHFIKRGRFGRLAHAIITNPGQLGIGLGEDAALIISRGDEAECRGSGMVVIIDGKNIEQTNITDVKEDEPVYVENLIVHLLVKGCRFSIKNRILEKSDVHKKS